MSEVRNSGAMGQDQHTRAAVLYGCGSVTPYSESRPLVVTDLQLDAPRATEVLVRVEAAGLCHSDLSVVNGNRVRPTPMALGHEASGVVVSVGDDVRSLVPGDHVVMVYVPSCAECSFCVDGQPALCERGAQTNGSGELLSGGRRLRDAEGNEVHHHLGVSAFSEYAVLDQSSLVKIDADVPFDVAALFGCAMATGYGAVARTAGVRPGDSVTIFGLGGVGLASVIAAKALGAAPIVVVDPFEMKRARALELGATHAAAPQDVEELVAEVSPGGTRWVFEAVGAAPVMEQAYRLTRRGGTTVYSGLPHPDAPMTISALSIIAEGRTVKGSYMGTTRPQEDIPEMVRLWKQGVLPVEALISSSKTLTEINEALDELDSGSALRQIIYPHE